MNTMQGAIVRKMSIVLVGLAVAVVTVVPDVAIVPIRSVDSLNPRLPILRLVRDASERPLVPVGAILPNTKF